MDHAASWHQVNVNFPDWDRAEQTAAARVAPRLNGERQVTAWWFIRKNPCWRIRYQAAPKAQSRAEEHFGELTAEGHLSGWTSPRSTPSVDRRGWTPRTACSTTTVAPSWPTYVISRLADIGARSP